MRLKKSGPLNCVLQLERGGRAEGPTTTYVCFACYAGGARGLSGRRVAVSSAGDSIYVDVSFIVAFRIFNLIHMI
jgi:hypothetical protein